MLNLGLNLGLGVLGGGTITPAAPGDLIWWGISDPSLIDPNTAVDKVGDLDPVKYVDNPCLEFTGAETLAVPGLVGTETITLEADSTSTPTAGAGSISFTAGLCYGIYIDGVLTYTCAENSGTTVYDITGSGNHATLSTDTVRATDDDAPAWFIRDGGGINGAVFIPALSINPITESDVLGDEEVTNGTFDGDGSPWNFGTAWYHDVDSARSDGVVTGFLDSDVDDSNLKAGAKYLISFDYDSSAGSARPYIFGIGRTVLSGSGTFEEIYEYASSSTPLRFRAQPYNGTIDNVSFKEILVSEDTYDAYVAGVTSQAADNSSLTCEPQTQQNGSPSKHMATDYGMVPTLVTPWGDAAQGAEVNGKPSYQLTDTGLDYTIEWDGATEWGIENNLTTETFSAGVDSTFPPTTGWSVGSLGSAAPTMGYDGSPWVDVGTSDFARISYADWLVHPNGGGATWLQWDKRGEDDRCHLIEIAVYDNGREFTVPETEQNEQWAVAFTGTCGS